MQKSAVPQGPFGELRISGGEKFAVVFPKGKFAGHVDEFDTLPRGCTYRRANIKLRSVTPSANGAVLDGDRSKSAPLGSCGLG